MLIKHHFSEADVCHVRKDVELCGCSLEQTGLTASWVRWIRIQLLNAAVGRSKRLAL